jgi:5-methylthioadenosine/S-adenosylhomocysteine deaminase
MHADRKETMSRDFLIDHVHIIDAEGVLHEDMRVRLSEGLIAGVESANAPPDFPTAETVDGRGCYLTPGLVNMHTHTPMNIFRGISEDVDADTWFNRDIWPYESLIEDADVRAGTLLAAAEMIDCGVTACADHYFSAEVICQAALEIGIRLDIAPTLFGPAGDFSGQLERTGELFRSWNGREGRIAVRFGPHSPYLCSPQELRMTAEAAGRLGTGAHIHLTDAEKQVGESIRKYGRTPFAVVHEAGLFDVPLIIGHGIFIREEERQLVSRDSVMVLCPKTYMKLGMGMGNVLQQPEQLPLTVGTDGAASSNTLSPLEQARLLALIGKGAARDGAAWKASDIWKMLMRGHQALPFGTGRVKAGAPADLVLWNLASLRTAPVYSPLSALIYGAGPTEVTHVWIGGTLVKRDGRLTCDYRGIIDEASERARALVRRGRGETRLVF